MIQDYPCPVCGGHRWTSVRTHSYCIDEHIPGGQWCENSYIQLRQRVLFEIWEGSTQVQLTSQYCEDCGFMCFTPRPGEADIENKYRFLSQFERETHQRGDRENEDATVQRDQKRAQQVWQSLSKVTVLSGKKVLDIGGGNGKLLIPFLDAQCECSLVDYYNEPLPGITRWGNTVEDIPDDKSFDALLCNHVLEHVANPLAFLKSFKPLLRQPTGIMYVEVPLEIWYDIPIAVDPVTHVNFFTLYSLLNLCRVAGLEVVAHGRRISSYGMYRMPVAWGIAKWKQRDGHTTLVSGIKTAQLIHPSPMHVLFRALLVDIPVERSLRPLGRLGRRAFSKITRSS